MTSKVSPELQAKINEGWCKVERSKTFDLLPVFSTCKAVFELAYIHFFNLDQKIETASTVEAKRYYTYLKSDETTCRLIFALIPVIGNLAIGIYGGSAFPDISRKFDQYTSKETVLSSLSELSDYYRDRILSSVSLKVQKDQDVIDLLFKKAKRVAFKYDSLRFLDDPQQLETVFRKYASIKCADNYSYIRSCPTLHLSKMQKKSLDCIAKEYEDEWRKPVEKEILQQARNSESVLSRIRDPIYHFHGCNKPLDGYRSKHFSDSFWRELCLVNPSYLEQAPEKLKKDKEYVLSCLDAHPKRFMTTYRFVKQYLGKDEEVRSKVEGYVKQYPEEI